MKKILSVTLVVILMLSVVACNEQKAEKYCYNCGKGILKTDYFCANCGATVKDNEENNEPSINVTPTTESTATNNVTSTPIETPEPTPIPNPYKNIQVEDYIKFGKYEQDIITDKKEDIEWLVLNVKGNKALLISKYALDCKEYNADYWASWENSSLRAWLNNKFFNTAFSEEEKAMILTVTITADKNPTYSTEDLGSDTQDKVFLLSIEEANEYFSSYNARMCKPTDYAKNKGAWIYTGDVSDFTFGNCLWMLRSPATPNEQAGKSIATVDRRGRVDISGYAGNYKRADYSIRPAIWIDIS